MCRAVLRVLSLSKQPRALTHRHTLTTRNALANIAAIMKSLLNTEDTEGDASGGMKRFPLLNFFFCCAAWLVCDSQAWAADPVLVGQWPGHPRGSARAVAVQGHLAYVAADRGGLMIINVIEPTRPMWLAGTLRMEGSRA